jgi:ABC-type transporter Mla subunit MlaD
MADRVPLFRRASVLLTLLTGLGLLTHYTLYLYREELRDWREVEVLFKDVGGLRKKDDVRVEGAHMGRVKSIELHEDEQLVTLQLLPEVELHDDAKVRIVSANSLGYVQVEVDPGTPGRPLIAPGAVLRGELAAGLGQGTSVPGKRKLLDESIDDFARSLERLRDPTSGRMGQLLFDRDGRDRLRAGLGRLEGLWRDVDRGLAQVEAGRGMGAGLDPAALDAVSNTVDAFRQTVGGAARGLREAARGEGRAGPLVADPTQAGPWRERFRAYAETSRDLRDGRGALGRWTDPGSGTTEALEGALERLREAAAEGARGRGLLGALSSPDYDQGVRGALDDAPGALRRFEGSWVVKNPDAHQKLQDSMANVDDALVSIRQFARSLRASNPSRTFAGAVFQVF